MRSITNDHPVIPTLRLLNNHDTMRLASLRSVAQLKRGMLGLVMPSPSSAIEMAFFKRAIALQIPLFIADRGVFTPNSFMFTDATHAISQVFYHGSQVGVPGKTTYENAILKYAQSVIGTHASNESSYKREGSVLVVCEHDDYKKLNLNIAGYADLVESMFPNDLCEFYFENNLHSKSLTGKRICNASGFYDACESAKTVVAVKSNYLYKAELANTNAFPLGLHPFLNKSRDQKRQILFQVLSQTIDANQSFADIYSQLSSKSNQINFLKECVDS